MARTDAKAPGRPDPALAGLIAQVKSKMISALGNQNCIPANGLLYSDEPPFRDNRPLSRQPRGRSILLTVKPWREGFPKSTEVLALGYDRSTPADAYDFQQVKNYLRSPQFHADPNFRYKFCPTAVVAAKPAAAVRRSIASVPSARPATRTTYNPSTYDPPSSTYESAPSTYVPASDDFGGEIGR